MLELGRMRGKVGNKEKVVGFKKIKDEGSVSLLPILSLILTFVFFQKILLLTVPNCSNALRNWKGTKE